MSFTRRRNIFSTWHAKGCEKKNVWDLHTRTAKCLVKLFVSCDSYSFLHFFFVQTHSWHFRGIQSAWRVVVGSKLRPSVDPSVELYKWHESSRELSVKLFLECVCELAGGSSTLHYYMRLKGTGEVYPTESSVTLTYFKRTTKWQWLSLRLDSVIINDIVIVYRARHAPCIMAIALLQAP